MRSATLKTSAAILFTAGIALLTACGGGSGGGDSGGSGSGAGSPSSVRYFSANDGVNGAELWKTDGTEAGTVMVKDINTTGSGSNPFGFTVLNGTTYFAANDGMNGLELWKTDGTTAGTVMVRDINAAAGTGSNPFGFTVFNGALYFNAGDGATGRELWKTDGTAAGTRLVRDINPGTARPNDVPGRCQPQTGMRQRETNGTAKRASGISHSASPGHASQVHQAEPAARSSAPNAMG